MEELEDTIMHHLSDEENDEDDFARYYRQFRRPGSSSTVASGSVASSVNGGGLAKAASNIWERALTLRRRRRPRQPSQVKSHSSETSSSAGGNGGFGGSASLSPLGGLSGMLSDKMTISSSSPSSHDEVDAISRDSGHSSGGATPDLRKRHSTPQPNPFFRDWHATPEMTEGYETARDLIDPVDVMLQATSYSKSKIQAMDIASLPSRMRSWSPDVFASGKRKVETCRDDLIFTNTVQHSPMRKSRKLIPPNVSSRTPEDSPDIHSEDQGRQGPRNGKIPLVLSRLCLLVQTLVMTLSCCLVVFIGFFAWRTYNCDTHRQLGIDLDVTKRLLQENLFGQHIAHQQILSELELFADAASKGGSNVLVLVLVGWVGGGKTYATSLLRRSFSVAENIHWFSVPLHFAQDQPSHLRFLDDLAVHVSESCGLSLVVFDDVDAASDASIEAMGNFFVAMKAITAAQQLASRPNSSSSNNGTLVLVTSNAGGAVINKRVLEAMRRGEPRNSLNASQVLASEDLASSPLRPLVKRLRDSDIRVSFVPFLPLARDHVRACVRSQAQEALTDEEVEKVLAEMSFFAKDFPVLSKTGCKQVAAKVNVVLGRHDPFLLG